MECKKRKVEGERYTKRKEGKKKDEKERKDRGTRGYIARG